MKYYLILLAIAFGLTAAPAASPGADDTMAFDHRDVIVVDGDTVMVAGKVYDLFGIDAPELGQQCGDSDHLWPCGKVAALSLRKAILLAALPLKCKTEQGAKPISTIVCAEGTRDLSLMLLKEGMAVTAANAPFGYQQAEAAAHSAQLGVWRDEFQRPADWRAATLPPHERTIDECPYIARKHGDQRIVVVPSIDPVPETDAAAARGAELFCSDSEAVEAGWSLRAHHDTK